MVQPHSLRLYSVVLAGLWTMVGTVAAHAQQPDTIIGTVTSIDAHPIVGIEVVITRAPDRQLRSSQTDSTGSYRVVFSEGTGDYLVHVTFPGWKPFRKRLTRVDSTVALRMDIRLQAEAVQLAGLKVQARRDRPRRAPEYASESGGSESVVDGVVGSLSPDDMGNLAALSSTVPGVLPIAGGLSVLGLGASQNKVTLNGMTFTGSEIPRDAQVTTRVASSAYDPARGGFSGAEIAMELATGTPYTIRRSHITLDTPILQTEDVVSRGLNENVTGVQTSAGLSGELVPDRYYYNLAVQGHLRGSNSVSLSNATPEVLRLSGVASDSVGRLLSLLNSIGIPTGGNAIRSGRISRDITLIGRLDHTPRAADTWGLTAYGHLSSNDATARLPTATEGHGGRLTSGTGSVYASRSFYYRKNTLNETKSGFTFLANQSGAYLKMPGGTVQVASNLDPGNPSLSTLTFGGNGSLERDAKRWSWETTNTTSWFDRSNAHRVKVFAQARVDGYQQIFSADRFGSFQYMSIADLAANRPASFSRSLESPTIHGGEVSGVIAIGDLWRASRSLQLQYGVRLEGNYFTARPLFNSAFENAFGVRNDYAPSAVHASPRFGFTWVLGGARDSRVSQRTGPMGTRSEGPRGFLRGGLGEFRNLYPADLLSPAEFATGVPGASRTVRCLGPSIPRPEWMQYSLDLNTIPSECLPSDNSLLIDDEPSVQLFDRAFAAPHSWRSNLAWSTLWLNALWSVEGTYSLNLNQPGVTELNFIDTPRIWLPDEQRPVFVSPEGIIAESGAVSAAGARRIPSFGRVTSHVSDLRSESRQLILTVTPELPFSQYFLRFSYVLSSTKAQFRGFDGATFDSPTKIEWGPSPYDRRHQALIQAGLTTRWANLTLFGRFASGTPFTPLVEGDVNGDGLVNDRAFVFRPGTADDSDVDSGIRSLIDRGPVRVRTCLERQLGAVAGRGSCRSPWSSSLNARLDVSRRLLHTGRRINLGLNLANVLGGLDQLTHGSHGLHGWGTTAIPDPYLLRVRGFDPAEMRFRYTPNPHFGETHPQYAAARAPFRITLDVSIDWGPSLPMQQVKRMLRPGRNGNPGTRLSADSLERLYSRNVPDVYTVVLQQTDSLLLSPGQDEELRTAREVYREAAHRIWRGLATRLAPMPDKYPAGDALRLQEDATDLVWELTRQQGETIRAVLSPLQLAMLPEIVTNIIDAKGKIQMRYFAW